MVLLRALLKILLHAVFLTLAFPMALTSGFGRLDALFVFWAQFCALFPGLPGDYLRIAYYRLTLEHCELDSRIQFGSFFAHSNARIGRRVYIGAFCILGQTRIGDRAQIGSNVQILSGKAQHSYDEAGQLTGSAGGERSWVNVGSDCWIGAAAVIMADIGPGTIVGAGSVVTNPIPAGSTAVGSPARVIKSRETATQV